MADIRLYVNERVYSGWKRVRLTRSVESIAGSFELEAMDRWAGQDEPWTIAEEDACKVAIDQHVLLDGFVDRRSISLSSSAHTLSYSGRDRTGALVDCAAILDRWTWRNIDPRQFIAQLCEPFDIAVSVQAGLRLERMKKLVVNPGDTVFQAIQRVAAAVGVLVVSDGAGGLVLTRSGTVRAAALTEGVNILAGSVEYDGSDRFHRYVVVSQVSGEDEASGDVTRIRAEALDMGVRRTSRVTMIRPEGGLPTELARRRGDWEARLRAARSESVSVTVYGWLQPDGVPWPVNALCAVKAPVLGVDGTLLISQVEHVLDSGGQVTNLRLVRPDAFLPEPAARVRNPSKDAPAATTAPAATEPTKRGFSRIFANSWKNPAGGEQ